VWVFLLCLALGGGASTLAAQFAAGVNLVEVYATVVDAQGEAVRGLSEVDFVVEEDGQRQAVSAFASGQFPLALAVGIDRSFSIPRSQLRATGLAVGGFLRQLRPDDLVTLLAVGSQVDVLSPLAADRGDAIAALAGLEPWGSTPLYDATIAALDAIQSAGGRRALILLSDGDDRYSQTTSTAVLGAARARDVLIYPVAIGPRRPPIFAELASVSGGRSFHVASARALPETLSTIARELRAQYLLGYSPASVSEGRPGWRSIRVTVNRPDVRVRARDGYRVPS
jgi:Ca-activated chloride channel homolog